MKKLDSRRIKVIVGHYGSGKTEFSVNYAVRLTASGYKTALVDLDIANPYFRSRERQTMLEEKGVNVYSNTFGYDITADLPAITAGIKAPLEDAECKTIIDAGGDGSGARILVQFDKYLKGQNCELLCVVNANRPETSSVQGALEHISYIESETNLKITGLVNNTHLLAETKAEDVMKGYRLCKELSVKRNIPIRYNCCTGKIFEGLKEKIGYDLDFKVFPIQIYMRDSWLDR